MINGKRIAVVMPAYNAEKTLEKTVRELSDIVDIKILVDDSSKDKTAVLSRNLVCGRLSMMRTTGMGATSRPAIARRSPRVLTSSSWCIPITSTRRCLFPLWRG